MSTLRNAAPRRPHKERSQPQSRAKWGLLEKHKDYSLRAQDYNLKKKKLTQLSRKAEEKNPDEFAFGMLSAGTAAQGKHGARGNENRLSHDAVKLLKTQDAGYLKDVVSRGRKEMKKIEEVSVVNRILAGQQNMNGVDKVKTVGQKITFGGDDQEVPRRGRKRSSDGFVKDLLVDQDTGLAADVSMADSEGDDIGIEREVLNEIQPNPDSIAAIGSMSKTPPKSKKMLMSERKATTDLRAVRKKRKKLQELREAKLAALRKRQKEIMAAADLLELQRAKMAKTVGGVNKDGVKFKIRERKR